MWLTSVVLCSLFFLLTMAYAISVWRKQRRYLKAYAAVSVMQTGV